MEYLDVADFEEDKRIGMIGDYVTRLKKDCAFVTDDEPGKAERYCKKLLERYPDVHVLSQSNGPVKGTITVKVGLGV